jgi:hypothetical protein
MRAAHLRGDLPQRQAPALQPQRQLPLLNRQVRLHPQPPQLIENLLDELRSCVDQLNPPRGMPDCDPTTDTDVQVNRDGALKPTLRGAIRARMTQIS